MHKQVVTLVILQTYGIGNTRRHRHSGHARRADKRIDFALGNYKHQLAYKQTADSGKHKSAETEHYNQKRLCCKERSADSSRADRYTEEQRNDIDKRVLRGIGESFGNAALLEEVTEHKASQKRSDGRQKQRNYNRDQNGENYLFALADLTSSRHNGHTLLFGCKQLHKRRL